MSPLQAALPGLRDRFRGALLGLAVGEALGAPAEFLSADQIVEKFGVITEMIGGGCHGLQPGETTDATEMMVCLAESLASSATFDPQDILERYAAWFDDRPRDVSLTVRTVLLIHRAGAHWDVASRRAFEILGSPTAGNGSLMRCPPLALRYAFDAEMRHTASLRESMLTHFDTLAGWSCVALNDLIVAALAGELLQQIMPVAEALEQEDRRVSTALLEAAAAEPEEIQNSAFVLDTLRSALWSVLHTGSFEEALCLTVNRGDDADTTAAVTGALAGALYGKSRIPRRWLEKLVLREHIATIADRLADLVGVA